MANKLAHCNRWKNKKKLPSPSKLRCSVAYKQRRREYLYKTYGLSVEQAKSMLDKGCSTCGSKNRRLCIDHDHRTGKVRGVLCHNCNAALGLLSDDVALLEKLRNYLLRYIPS